MKALSFREPWLWMMFALGKGIENRTRRMGHTGPFLLHRADAWFTKMDAFAWVKSRGLPTGDYGLQRSLPGRDAACFRPRKGIVGRAVMSLIRIRPDGQLEDPAHAPLLVTLGVDRRWHIPGQWGHVVTHLERIPFFGVHGSQG